MPLTLSNISKRHKDRWLLRDISFEVSRGEIFGISGPSGAGKTALLEIIAGSSQPNGGAILFDDKNVTKLDPPGREFDAPKPSDGSIWQRLLKNDKGFSKNERARRYLNDSVGRARRLLILDDPFCGLDTAARNVAIEKMRAAVKERDLSIVLASSNFAQILETCDRSAVIIKGEIRQVGPPQEIYEKPNSRDVAQATGRNNIFLARRLTSSKADIPEFHTIEGGHRLFAQRVERGALGALNQNVTLAIRPEHVSISFGASFPADNLLKATITAVRFLGPTTLVELDADGLKLKSLVLRLVGLNIGDECMVGLPPERILVLRD